MPTHSLMDDILFFTSLFVCMSLGSYYKSIEEIDMKRNYGAGLGLLVICVVCGRHIYHSIFMVWGNVVIIRCCEKRYVHLMSLAYTWCYLVYLHFNVVSSQYIIWIHQTLALRLSGLAFEVFITEKAKDGVAEKDIWKSKSDKIDNISPEEVPARSSMLFPNIAEMDVLTSDPSAVDIISYAFFFVGIHKGPYYRWKIFNDHLNAPFGVLGDCRIITTHKLKKAFLCAFAYILLRMKFSPALYYTDEFYTSYGSDSRFMYGMPQLMMYFLQSQFVMMLCTSVCTETGFGVYPAKSNPIPGHGPSTGLSLLKLASTTPDVALEQEYNFSILKCFDNTKLLIGPKMRDTIRSFDMPTQYWFWVYTYKHVLRAKKEVRIAFSFLIWSIWQGPSLQQAVMASTTWVYLHLEAEFIHLYDTEISSMNIAWSLGFYIMRMMYLAYITPCLVISDTAAVFRFYNSIFWVYHLLLLFLMIFSVLVYKSRTIRHRYSNIAGQ